jgi:AhpD family alkylhydroperoxidase
MEQKELPKHFLQIKKRFADFFKAVEELGQISRTQGPLDEKTSHLIQLAAAATLRSEGSVHSHARRAVEAGAQPDEVYHALIVLTSTIGFPNVAAALSWVDEVLAEE